MIRFYWMVLALVIGLAMVTSAPAETSLSEATETCLECHTYVTPGIVAGWERSRHARVSPAAGLKVDDIARRISADQVPPDLADVAVGCAECHTLRPEAHADTFEHNEYQIHLAVSPKDCATCHPVEAEQYDQNLMARAYHNLKSNTLYQTQEASIISRHSFAHGRVALEPANDHTRAETCYACHGTELKVVGSEVRDTDLGEMEFPKLSGWPNQGVGRINLDGSRGSCAACHTRHGFSVKMARQPHTCKQCHVGPDVPAFKVYSASKHGNIYSSMGRDFDFGAIPWEVGRDFTAPTCAACHISLLVDSDETVIAERSHQMTDRLPWRLFGLIYAHPQPKSPDTTIIRNADGLQAPTDFKGGWATEYLIDQAEMDRRTATMQAVCLSCHGTSWVRGHFERLDNSIAETNHSVGTATRIMEAIWDANLAQGPPAEANPMDEAIEKKWMDTWLLYGNTIRFAAAMAGGGDYGVYAGGRYQLSQQIKDLEAWYRDGQGKNALP